MNLKGGFNDLKKILDRLAEYQNDKTGAFRYEDKKHSEPQEGVFSTIEGIVPFLLFPYKEFYQDKILLGIDYLIDVSDKNNGKINPKPEYPNYDERLGSVDGAAYTLYVFTLARYFIKNQLKDEKRCQPIDKQISLLLQYIKDNQNLDNGWGIVKHNNLKSRTYSTSLVVFALNNCEENDFDNAKVDGKALQQEGITFLLTKNMINDEGVIKWSFSEPLDDDTEDIKTKKMQYNPNITAVAIFSLSNVLHTTWRRGELEWEEEIKEAISLGANYIVETSFDDLNNPILKDAYEPVSYPFTEEKGAGIAIHKYEHPYQMILPSLVLAPGISIYDNKCDNIKTLIFESVFGKLRDDKSRAKITNLKIYELSDSAYALIYYYCVNLAIEGCINNVLKKGELFECLIRDDGNIDNCYNWNLYESKLVSAHNEEIEALKASHNEEIKTLKAGYNTINKYRLKSTKFFKTWKLNKQRIYGVIVTIILTYIISIIIISQFKKEIELNLSNFHFYFDNSNVFITTFFVIGLAIQIFFIPREQIVNE